MYHLRRSGYLNVFNSSPDESSILRLQLLKSCVEDSMTQIQPALYSYTLEGAPEPVSLDSSAIKPDNILILDTFFEVLIHYGSTIAEWRRAGYADQEDYAYFRDFLEVPMNDAQTIASARYPTPRLIDVCQNDPDSRILYNRINPSKTYVQMDQTTSNTPNTGDLVYTDDTSLEAFTAHLKKLAVSE
ncbi:protein transport protein Sec23A [Angomonas deanei]|nr:protein transport protein Sec23A [Angomonas deanei]|eukprot:EPY41884.1 protein transport protein Sec23A [Angomonas deanei]